MEPKLRRCRFFDAYMPLVFMCTIIYVSGNASAEINKLRSLPPGYSLTTEKNNTCLVSPNETFCAGFYKVGENAYSFAVWYTHTLDRTVAWMANRGQPVNGRDSRLDLQTDGDLVL
eukprot:Gb_14017 [translate_table: standard]